MCVRCKSAVLALQADASEEEISQIFPGISDTFQKLSMEERLLLALGGQHDAAEAPVCEVCMQSGISEISRSVETLRTYVASLNTTIKDNAYLQHFNKNIREVFDYFEFNKELPVILVNRRGEYVIN